jgi:pimeloyl-ACP methyl ester carboxylesterase
MSVVTTRDNVRLYFKDWGHGRPVILMHGWPLSADTFDALGIAIADSGMRAIAYDRRGFGRSDQPWSGYDYETLSDDLADVMAHVGANHATLLGFSMGGGEVARYMSRHAGRYVKQAILIRTGSIRPSSHKWRPASVTTAPGSGRRSSRCSTASRWSHTR